MEEWLTITEAAAELGIGESALRTRIRKGQVRAERAGARLLLIERAEVDRLKAIGKARPWALRQRREAGG